MLARWPAVAAVILVLGVLALRAVWSGDPIVAAASVFLVYFLLVVLYAVRLMREGDSRAGPLLLTLLFLPVFAWAYLAHVFLSRRQGPGRGDPPSRAATDRVLGAACGLAVAWMVVPLVGAFAWAIGSEINVWNVLAVAEPMGLIVGLLFGPVAIRGDRWNALAAAFLVALVVALVVLVMPAVYDGVSRAGSSGADLAVVSRAVTWMVLLGGIPALLVVLPITMLWVALVRKTRHILSMRS